MAAGCIVYIFGIERQNSRHYQQIADGRREMERLSARLGMEERVKQLGGRLEIQSQPGHGTLLRATLPMAAGATE
jgi:signal transduction histidine kinase